ncbi:MAG: DMT family transporter [Hyphomicrobiales bacterium]|nr:DMT family transporter [Hyphomicrobiales bacterium]
MQQQPAAAERAPAGASPAVRRTHIPLGIAYMVAATLIFSVTSAVAKWQVATYPAGEVVCLRGMASLATILLFILPQTGLGVFRTRRLRDHIQRGFSQTCSQTCIVLAFSLMPLAGAVAINFSAPLFATLLAALLLREPVGPYRWMALIVGFLGVLVVTHPGAGTFQLGALFALTNAVLFATVTVAVRRMTDTESAQTLIVHQMVWIMVFSALTLPFGFVVPTLLDGVLLALSGIGNAMGQYWWTKALHLAPTSAVTPFSYLSLVWAIVIGLVVWGDVPGLGLIGGSAIVVGSGLFLLWHETSRKRG